MMQTGIERIADKIVADANLDAAAIAAGADAECQDIRDRALDALDAECDRILALGELERKSAIYHITSRAESASKQAILAEKQQLIREAFQLAERMLAKRKSDARFQTVVVLPDGTTQSKPDIAMALSRYYEQLTPKVAEILFSD
ncbi:MAG: hypothetical protein LBC65_01545 [Oscillospiraceae bacterium]|jgi:vacuolar-type H+-ATPase subunit E/Vma4|nr:hypothetical protein [Oscillospiraceae bacterium]